MQSRILIFGIITLACMKPALVGQAQQAPPLVLIQIGAGGIVANSSFEVHLKNGLSVPITFCADYGQFIQAPSGVHSAPNPFLLQRWTGSRWDTQLTGTDVYSSSKSTVNIDAHESTDFIIVVGGPGRYRIQLRYLEGKIDIKCPITRKSAVILSSAPFVVHNAPVPRQSVP